MCYIAWRLENICPLLWSMPHDCHCLGYQCLIGQGWWLNWWSTLTRGTFRESEIRESLSEMKNKKQVWTMLLSKSPCNVGTAGWALPPMPEKNTPSTQLWASSIKRCLNWIPPVFLGSLFTEIYKERSGDWSKSGGTRDASRIWLTEAWLCSFNI